MWWYITDCKSARSDSNGCQRQADAIVNVSAVTAGTVTIGTQKWMKINLDVDCYRNGDLIPQVQDHATWANLTTGAWCYLTDEANGLIYSKLYNWYAVNDSRGLASIGYHLPTDAEWTILINYLGGDQIAGGKLKESGQVHWGSLNVANNSSGFTALPGFGRFQLGALFNPNVKMGYFWSSTQSSSTNSWYRRLFHTNTIAYREDVSKNYGMSIRCIKD